MARTALIGLTLAVACVVAPASAGAQQADAGGVVTIPRGEIREGDLYSAGDTVRVDGRLAGDLVAAAARRVVVDGQVDGDIFAAAYTIDLRGPVGDSTRVAAQDLTVETTIDGDLIAAVTQLHLLDGARVTGGIAAVARLAEIDGTVDGDVRVAAGEIIVRGTLGGNARLIADRVDLAPGARIDGDLDYRAAEPLSSEAAARVAGAVRRDEAADEVEPAGSSMSSFLFWSWQAGAALVTGLLAIALFRRVVRQLVTAIAGETTVGGLLGFGAFLVVPAAAAVAMVTLIGLPLGVVAILLFGVALYVAKLPVAVWVGGRLLALAGRSDASPYAAMAIGILVLYALFETPYLGWLIWLAATWLGLGAMVLSGRRFLPAHNG